MSRQIVQTLVFKDVKLYFRNRFFAFVSIMGIVAYAAIYYIMPSTVDEALDLAIYAPVMPPIFEETPEEGLSFVSFNTEEALKQAISDGDYQAGIVLPEDIMEALPAGRQTLVDVYFSSEAPEELTEIVTTLVRELLYAQTGQPLNIAVNEEVLGRDFLGMQVAPRDRLLPMFGVFIILTETLGMASLISEEVEGRTAQALLITPMKISGLFTAKGITGVSLALVQVLALVLLTGGFRNEPLLVFVALVLGAVMVTGIGFLLASLGKDLMSVMAWGIPVMLVMVIPAFAVLFPGVLTDWVRLIPSFYLVDTVHQVANLGAGWRDVWQNLVVMLAVDVALMWLGTVALRRKLT